MPWQVTGVQSLRDNVGVTLAMEKTENCVRCFCVLIMLISFRCVSVSDLINLLIESSYSVSATFESVAMPLGEVWFPAEENSTVVQATSYLPSFHREDGRTASCVLSHRASLRPPWSTVFTTCRERLGHPTSIESRLQTLLAFLPCPACLNPRWFNKSVCRHFCCFEAVSSSSI